MATTDQENLQLTKDMYNAFSKGDLNVLRNYLTNNTAMKLMAMNQTLKGPNDIVNYFGVYRSAFNATVESLKQLACGDTVVSEFVGKGIHTNVFPTPMGDIPPTNKRIEVPVCHILQWKDGKIVDWHEYFDVNTLLSQIGVGINEAHHA